MTVRRVVRGAFVLAASAAIAGVFVPASASGARSTSFTDTHLYWSEPSLGRGPAGPGINKVWRAGVNGTPVSQSFISALAFPAAVAAHGQYVYWSDNEAGAIGRCNLDHTQIDHTFIHVPEAAALAVSDSYIYWTESGSPASIWRAGLNGSGAQKLVSIGNGGYIGGLTLYGNYIYWTNRDQGTIGRVKVNGSDPQPGFITGLSNPTGLAADSTGLYWAITPSGSGGAIGKAELSGANVNSAFITGADEPFGVTLGAGHVYWANNATGTIGRARRDGTHVNENFILAQVTQNGSVVADPFDIAAGP